MSKKPIDPFVKCLIWARDRGVCQVCLKAVTLENMEGAHLQAECCAGLTTEDNLVTAHHECNKHMPQFKTKELAQEWISLQHANIEVITRNHQIPKSSRVPQQLVVKPVVKTEAEQNPNSVLGADGNIDVSKISRTAIARALGIDLAHISRIFSKQRSPSLDLARRMATYLGVSLDKLQCVIKPVLEIEPTNNLINDTDVELSARRSVVGQLSLGTEALREMIPDLEPNCSFHCAKCGGNDVKVRLYGFVWIGGKQVQKYQCLGCGYVSIHF